MSWVLSLLLCACSAADITPPAAASISVQSCARRSLTLSWTAPGDDGTSGQAASYDLRVSILGPIDTFAKFDAAAPVAGLPAPQAAGALESFTVPSLNPGSTYYFALRTADEAPNASGLSNPLTGKTLDLFPPAEVAGLRGARDTGTGAFTLTWSPVTRYADGSLVDQEFDHYTVWRATSVWGAYQALTDLSTTVVTYTHAGSLAASAYYRVTAGDVIGSTSTPGPSLDNTERMNLVFVSEDCGARIDVPAASQGVLGDMSLVWTRDVAEESGRVLRSYSLAASGTDIVFPYPGAVLALSAPSGFSQDSLAMFRFNGVDYVKLGPLQTQVTQLGKYRLQQSMRTAGFSITQVVPTKTFTPNGDGVNDTVEIFFENPADEVASGDVFDLTGTRVAGLRHGTTSGSLVWDGKDASGRPARTGVYVYQVRVGAETANGTVILAR
ncbi:MAG: gliding motility-associated C-terminal domain-containing protein [Elusimicrobiota bacterium]